jgi:hypothetical protein
MRAGTPAGEAEPADDKEEDVQRLAVIAQLKPGASTRAKELIEQGPPFSPAETGFERHTVFASGDHVVFVFEGGKLDRLLRDVVENPTSVGAFREWQALLDGLPSIAREAYSWQRGEPWAEGWGE